MFQKADQLAAAKELPKEPIDRSEISKLICHSKGTLELISKTYWCMVLFVTINCHSHMVYASQSTTSSCLMHSIYVYDSSMFIYIWSPNDLNACRSELPAMVIHFPDCIIACAVLDHPPLNVQMQISYLVEQIINHVWALYRQCFLVHKLIRKQQHNETE